MDKYYAEGWGMSNVVKFKDIFGDENLMAIGEKDVFIVFPGQTNEDGDPRVVMVPKSAVLECAGKIRSENMKDNLDKLSNMEYSNYPVDIENWTKKFHFVEKGNEEMDEFEALFTKVA